MTHAQPELLPTLDTVAALDDLPVGAVVRSERGDVWLVDDPETDGTELRYVGAGTKSYFTGSNLLALNKPLTAIWDPRANRTACHIDYEL